MLLDMNTSNYATDHCADGGRMATFLSPELFWSTDELTLAGIRCRSCGTVGFPVSDGCSACGGGSVEAIALPDKGTIWTWTVQRFAPKSPYEVAPEGFAPFAVGYVDLSEVLVESVILGDVELLAIGQQVHLVPYPLPGSDDTASYAFQT
jgi:uncharacterized protein